MSAPVKTETWAGTFACEGPCKRTRLMGSEFSNKSLEKYRKSMGVYYKANPFTLRCKKCVSDVEIAERNAAAKRRANATSNGTNKECPKNGSSLPGDKDQQFDCAGGCNRKKLSPSLFNRNQLSKGNGKARCRECVEKSVQKEMNALDNKQDDEIEKARVLLSKAEVSGDAIMVLKASSHLASLEAQKVTGLKPVVLGRGGRGRGRGRGAGRGRGGSGGRTTGQARKKL